MRRLTWDACGIAFCLLLVISFQVTSLTGCRATPEFALSGIRLLMDESELERLLGEPVSYVGDTTFRWAWYEDGLVVGLAQSAGGSRQVAWVVQTSGQQSAGLKVGTSRLDVERRLGKATQIADSEARIQFTNQSGHTLDVVLIDDAVSAFILSLPSGVDPDIDLTFTAPSSTPTFRFGRTDALEIFPTVPGTTRVHLEYFGDDTGCTRETVVRRTEKEAGLVEVVIEGEHVLPGTTGPYRKTYVVRGSLVFTVLGHMIQPAELYEGLEWGNPSVAYTVVGRATMTVQAGTFPDAIVVDCLVQERYPRTIYYQEGIGMIKQDPGAYELLEFTAGSGG